MANQFRVCVCVCSHPVEKRRTKTPLSGLLTPHQSPYTGPIPPSSHRCCADHSLRRPLARSSSRWCPSWERPLRSSVTRPSRTLDGRSGGGRKRGRQAGGSCMVFLEGMSLVVLNDRTLDQCCKFMEMAKWRISALKCLNILRRIRYSHCSGPHSNQMM